MNWKRTFILLATITLVVCGSAMAATHSKFVTGNPIYDPKDNEVFVISNTVDFGDLSTAGPVATGVLSGVTPSDVVQLLDIPAGTIVKNVGIYIYSAWGTSGVTCPAVTIGDGTDPNGWITAVDFGPSASGVSNSNGAYVLVTTDFDLAKYYSTADTIDATIPAVANTWRPQSLSGLTDFVLQIWAECVKPSTQEAYTH